MNNIIPRSRADRDALNQKDKKEKDGIDRRSGWEARHINAGQLIHGADIKSTLYIPESERFDKDFAVYDKLKRDKNFKVQQNYVQQTRQTNLERNKDFWTRQQNWDDGKKQHLKELKNFQEKGNRNNNMDGFDLINMDYIKGRKGDQLKTKENDAEVRYLVRQTNLSQRSNSTYNIMTGEIRAHSHIPCHLQQKYQDKVHQNQDYLNQFKRQ